MSLNSSKKYCIYISLSINIIHENIIFKNKLMLLDIIRDDKLIIVNISVYIYIII